MIKTIALICCLIATLPAFGEVARVYYRTYQPSDKVVVELGAKFAELEKTAGIVEPPTPIAAPPFLRYPEPFSIKLRRGRTVLWVTFLALVSEKGKTERCILLGASDDEVGEVAGKVLMKARYKPALLKGKPVPFATIISLAGAGISEADYQESRH